MNLEIKYPILVKLLRPFRRSQQKTCLAVVAAMLEANVFTGRVGNAAVDKSRTLYRKHSTKSENALPEERRTAFAGQNRHFIPARSYSKTETDHEIHQRKLAAAKSQTISLAASSTKVISGQFNHNGISETDELKSFSELGLAEIELDYKKSKRTDEHGNQFRYRAKVKDVKGAKVRRRAWDVYLVQQP